MIQNRQDKHKYKHETKIFVSNVLRDICENISFKLINMMKHLKCNKKIQELHINTLHSMLCLDINNTKQ